MVEKRRRGEVHREFTDVRRTIDLSLENYTFLNFTHTIALNPDRVQTGVGGCSKINFNHILKEQSHVKIAE